MRHLMRTAKTWRCAIVLISCVPYLNGSQLTAGSGDDALAILSKHCAKCHAAPSNTAGFGFVTDLVKLVDRGTVAKGNPDGSLLYQKIVAGDMPPPGEEPEKRPLTSTEVETIAKWIREGAPPSGTDPTPAPIRQPIPLLQEFEAILSHLHSVDREDRKFVRYFTLRNIHNTRLRTNEEIDFCRAALGKALNSVTWKQRLIFPDKLDALGVTFGIDIRDLEWDTSLWDELACRYPYALKHDTLPADRRLNDVAADIYRLTETDVPILRADWFVTKALRPPIYHALLQIPLHERDLERRLRINAGTNIVNGKVMRKGMNESGVSEQNRLIERHDGTFGYYWKSYDFKPANARGGLVQLPLGPAFEGTPFPQFAFEHNGGELIFRLPNGLQGYMLVDGKGGRIDTGPPDVVADQGRFGGNVEVINGISCIACHSQGMLLGEPDVVRTGTALQGRALRFLERIYPPDDVMNKQILEDQAAFRDAVVRAMQGVAENDAALRRPDGSVLEPIAALAKGYALYSLAAEDLASELDAADAATLVATIKADRRFARIGLGPIGAQTGKIKRLTWEQSDNSFSPFQRAASLLNLGEPKQIQCK